MEEERNIISADVDDSFIPRNGDRVDFSKIKVGLKTLDDAVLDVSNYKKINPRLGDIKEIYNAMNLCDYGKMRDISNFFYRTSGIYANLCKYAAYMYRYDWLVTPYTVSSSVNKDKILDGFNKVLMYLDNFEVKKIFEEIALKIVINGCYYGYVVEQTNQTAIQELPPKYCRARYKVNNKPAVEFNMKFFDDEFKDTEQRMRILNLFPKEFKKGYIKYREGKIPPEYIGDTNGWYLLDVNNCFKFNISNSDFPLFLYIIPAIIDLDEAQALDKKRMQQQLVKLIIQKLPLDKNGDMIFDMDEVGELHNNAVRMIGRAIGIDILTTLAEVDVADMADDRNSANNDELTKVERGVYNEAGTSQMLFNTDGNIALEKSVLKDESFMHNLLLQFESFLNDLIKKFNKNPKKMYFKVQFLTTTIYNYKEMAKAFKEMTQLGYSKMLPQIALGQSQSSILANAHFENEVLDLVTLFVPPLSSNTMSADAVGNIKSGDKKAGRPEKENGEKTEKTIKNIEAKS